MILLQITNLAFATKELWLQTDFWLQTDICLQILICTYGVASVSRIDKITGLFFIRALYKRLYSAKETHNFIDPTNRSHQIAPWHCTHFTDLQIYRTKWWQLVLIYTYRVLSKRIKYVVLFHYGYLFSSMTARSQKKSLQRQRLSKKERERERASETEMETDIHTYIYIYIYTQKEKEGVWGRTWSPLLGSPCRVPNTKARVRGFWSTKSAHVRLVDIGVIHVFDAPTICWVQFFCKESSGEGVPSSKARVRGFWSTESALD